MMPKASKTRRAEDPALFVGSESSRRNLPHYGSGWNLFHGRRYEQSTAGILYIVPLIVVLLVLLLYPIGYSIFGSMQSKIIGSPGKFIGLGNFVELVTKDQAFSEVFFNTVLYASSSVLFKVLLGFTAALVLNERVVAQSLFRGWMLIPWIIPTLVVGLMFRWMFDQSGGILNFIIEKTGLMKIPPAWLADKVLARAAVIFANVWRGFPFFMITILAAMQSIPGELYEAAEMDGTSAVQRIRYITIPGVKAVTLVVVILSTIWTFNDFELLWVMTGGGPSYSTHIFVTYAYQLSFLGSRFGYAMAVSLVATPIIIISIILLVPRLLGEEE
jgi:ABC-type sugar transport system permease subunit